MRNKAGSISIPLEEAWGMPINRYGDPIDQPPKNEAHARRIKWWRAHEIQIHTHIQRALAQKTLSRKPLDVVSPYGDRAKWFTDGVACWKDGWPPAFRHDWRDAKGIKGMSPAQLGKMVKEHYLDNKDILWEDVPAIKWGMYWGDDKHDDLVGKIGMTLDIPFLAYDWLNRPGVILQLGCSKADKKKGEKLIFCARVTHHKIPVAYFGVRHGD